MRTNKNTRVDDRDFVVTYLRSRTVDDLASAMGMSKSGIYAKTKYLRQRGVLLPLPSEHFDSSLLSQRKVDELNNVIRKHLKQIAQER